MLLEISSWEGGGDKSHYKNISETQQNCKNISIASSIQCVLSKSLLYCAFILATCSSILCFKCNRIKTCIIHVCYFDTQTLHHCAKTAMLCSKYTFLITKPLLSTAVDSKGFVIFMQYYNIYAYIYDRNVTYPECFKLPINKYTVLHQVRN